MSNQPNTVSLVYVFDKGVHTQEVKLAELLGKVFPQWTTYSACAAIEGFDGEDHDQVEIVSAFQHLIDTGAVWSLQGWYGRTAQALIEQGFCTPQTK